MKDMEDLDGDLDVAFWLTRSIGRCIGLNFSDAMEEGRLDPQDFAALITVCRACPYSEPCKEWLGKSAGPRGERTAPSFCPNAEALQALKPH